MFQRELNHLTDFLHSISNSSDVLISHRWNFCLLNLNSLGQKLNFSHVSDLHRPVRICFHNNKSSFSSHWQKNFFHAHAKHLLKWVHAPTAARAENRIRNYNISLEHRAHENILLEKIRRNVEHNSFFCWG